MTSNEKEIPLEFQTQRNAQCNSHDCSEAEKTPKFALPATRTTATSPRFLSCYKSFWVEMSWDCLTVRAMRLVSTVSRAVVGHLLSRL
jgi:hypothetical protein